MAAPKIVLDSFVKNVRPDPKATDPIIYLCGFLGDSPVEGNVRVYADPQLSSFVDVPRSAILHAVQNTPEEDTLGGSKLWIKQADIANQSPLGSSYLEGDIYTNYATNMYQPAGAQPLAFTIPPWACPRITVNHPICRTLFGPRSLCRPCFTNNSPICKTINLVQCRSLVVVQCTITRNPPCEILSANCPTWGACPSRVDACPTAPTDFTTVINPTIHQTIYEAGTFNPYMHGGY